MSSSAKTSKRASVATSAAKHNAYRVAAAYKKAEKPRLASSPSAFSQISKAAIKLQMMALAMQLELLEEMETMSDEEKLVALFALLDKDRSGSLSAVELAGGLRKIRGDVTFEESLELAMVRVAQFDKDGDGKFQLSEFQAYVDTLCEALGASFHELSEMLIISVVFNESGGNDDAENTVAPDSLSPPSSASDYDNHVAEVCFQIVGDAYVDFFCFLDGNWPEYGGDSRLDQPVRSYAGGSSTNTATHLKALVQNFSDPKPPVVLHTVLNPNDQYGHLLLAHAEHHKIPIHNCQKAGDNATTGHCIAIVSGGERSFMTHQGVVGNFRADELDVDCISDTPANLHLHVAGFYNIPGFWDGQLKGILATIRERRKQRFPDKYTTISLVTQHDATNAWDGGLDELVPLLDFVLMNDLEARSIIKRGGHVVTDWEHEHLCWADYFGKLSLTSNVIVTRGEKGAVALRGGEVLGKQKPIVVKAIDPTGAGDSFTAGFIHGIWSWKLAHQGMSNESGEQWPIEAIEEGMRWGVSVGSAAVMIRGASVPPEGKDVQSYLEQAKEPEHPIFQHSAFK